MMMKLYLIRSFLVSLICLAINCSTKDPGEGEVASDRFQTERATTSYEGQVIFDTSKYLHLDIRVSMTSETEGKFRVTEFVIEDEKEGDELTWEGFCRLYRNESGQPMLVLENTSREQPLKRTTLTKAGTVRESNFRNTDLVFYVFEDHLELLDREQIVCGNPECFFYRRTSPQFTIEGYLMYRGDTSYFYEMNTKVQWPLTKLGSYYQAAREHNTLADKKNDTTYLKATGYSISTMTKSEGRRDALVLRRIIQSSSL